MTPPPADQATLDTAVRLLREAGERTLRWFRAADLMVERKGDGTPVTAADKDAERFLREQLADAFPADGILGEEEAPTPGTSGRRWIIDPIDGTKAFTCGVPLYSNLLALEDEHGIAVGVVNLPALGETVWAGRGLGCWSDRGPAQVSDHPTLEGAYVMSSSFSHWAPGTVAALEAACCARGATATATPSWPPDERRRWSTPRSSPTTWGRCPCCSPRPGDASPTSPAR
ncbi:MAG: inositol monophosphatase family protein [Acidimicrobiales bacterium]